ncbi:hypothetical protein BFW38_16200 [Terasakiispira papahanaumokuakeensis]|uniref:Crp/Fnr family transcriptional regulator n=1 Tax=Terasakiispira papahanaumokuakeensis TaxID=197479 RepID=A0A1E2VDA7_9GAMM|nr:Crp/Fnr family transcriptional regulator [Terasakiispira papahanaumokuakeensis]ODC04842.1 hypothetical protein BFW38_16200 [Terasakiispira papahanaumokuakeensis]
MAVSTELLSRFDILKTLSPDALEQLASQSALRKLARRGVALNAGQQEEFLCFLFEGRLQGIDFTLDGREVGLYFVEPGEFCGEVGLFDQGPQPEYVMALARSQVVMVPMATLRQVMFESRPLMEALCARMAYRVRALTSHRGLLALPSVAQRVCGQLWMLLQASAGRQDSPPLIQHPPTHQEMAIMLNLSRESVTRVFQTLQSRAVVQRDGNTRLLIPDASTLEALAKGDQEL